MSYPTYPTPEFAFNKYQRLSAITRSDDADLITAALGIAGEGGEFADSIKKWHAQGHPLDHAHLIEELGDLLWYVSLAADLLGVPLGVIALRNVEKLAKRYPDGFSTERSMNREGPA